MLYNYGNEWLISQPGNFTAREGDHSTKLIVGWMGLRASVDILERSWISCPCRDLNPRSSVLQPNLWSELFRERQSFFVWRYIRRQSMHLVPQKFDIPKTCISGCCKSEDTQTLSNVWHENDNHFYASPVMITLKCSKGQPRLPHFFYTLMNFISLIYLK